jgi:hypothetical protein
MTVRLPDGSEFDQYKSTMTTIKYFPGQEAAPISPGGFPSGSSGAVVHADAEVPAGQPAQGTAPRQKVGVTPAGGEIQPQRSGANPGR